MSYAERDRREAREEIAKIDRSLKLARKAIARQASWRDAVREYFAAVDEINTPGRNPLIVWDSKTERRRLAEQRLREMVRE